MTNTTTRRTFPVTCAVLKCEHQVADEQFAVERDDIRLKAVCGGYLIPAHWDTPPGRPCPDCRAVLNAPPPPPPPRQPIDVADLLERAKTEKDPRVREAAARIPLQRARPAHRRRCLFERRRAA